MRCMTTHVLNLSPQDASLSVKGRILNLGMGESIKFTFGAAAGLSAPISNYNTESSNAIGQRATVVDGRLFFQFHINNGFFIQAQGGYGLAGEPVPSFVPVSIKMGYTSSICWLLCGSR